MCPTVTVVIRGPVISSSPHTCNPFNHHSHTLSATHSTITPIHNFQHIQPSLPYITCNTFNHHPIHNLQHIQPSSAYITCTTFNHHLHTLHSTVRPLDKSRQNTGFGRLILLSFVFIELGCRFVRSSLWCIAF